MSLRLAVLSVLLVGIATAGYVQQSSLPRVDSKPEAGTLQCQAAKARAERDAKQTGRHKKVCLTDPDATMATSARNRRLEPAYKQHTARSTMFLAPTEVPTNR